MIQHIMKSVNRTLSIEHKKKIGEANSISQIGNSNAKGHKLSDEWKKNHSERIKKLHKEKPNLYNKQREIARENFIGEKNPRWKGGISLKNQQARHTLEYFSWRNEVYKRDNWTCRICKLKCDKKTIIAHHLKLFSDFPELRYCVDNGITLCRVCHGQVHQNKLLVVYE